jgi:hypothetical protein
LRDTLLRLLLPLEWEYRVRAGDQPRAAEYEARFPDAAAMIDALGRDVATAANTPTHSGPPPPARACSGWGTTASSVAWAAAEWAWSTRRCRSRCAGAWHSRYCPGPVKNGRRGT